MEVSPEHSVAQDSGSVVEASLQWELMRSEWKKGTPAKLSSPQPIDADAVYEQLLASEKEGTAQTSFEQPVPLSELIAILTEGNDIQAYMDWVCPYCNMPNEGTDICDNCRSPHKGVKPQIPKRSKKEEEEEEEEEEEYAGSSEDEMEDDIDLHASKGFDTVVGSALAKESKRKIQALADIARKKLGKDRLGTVEYDENTLIVRAALPVDFLDTTMSKVWGINKSLPIFLELKFNLETPSHPPSFSLYQAYQKEINHYKLSHVSSFGLEWQLRARLDDWLNGAKTKTQAGASSAGEHAQKKQSVCNWPPKEGEDWINAALDYLIYRINTCTSSCIICDGELPFQMIKPSVCANSLCIHSHEQYGLGADVATEMRERSDVVDLLITFCAAMCEADVRRFNPFPLGVEVKYKDEHGKEVATDFMQSDGAKSSKNPQQVRKVIDLLPAVSELRALSDTRTVKNMLDKLHPLAFPLLRWIITSNRAHLAKLDTEDMIKEMSTEHQYKFLSSPPEKEAKFQEIKKKKGSFWAFHGSSFANWHSILRIGLRNFSNTELMTTGAAYGPGIYLSPNSGTSMGYAYATKGWSKSLFAQKGANSLQCLAICEVIDDNYKANPHFVIPNEDHVMTRYFMIYCGTAAPSLEASTLKNLKSVEIKTK